MAIPTEMAARRVCEIGEWRVTNLQLQKILYLCQMVHLATHQGRLVDASFEAWDYGPVLPSLYRRVWMFGSRPIQDIFRLEDGPVPGDELSIIDRMTPGLVIRTPPELVSLTHWADGAWARNYKPGTRGRAIPDADLIDEYRARAGRRAA